MFRLTANHNHQYVFLIDSRRTVIVHQDVDAIGTRVDFAGIERIHAGESGSFITKIDGRETLVTFHPTSVQGWKMVSTIPMSVIREQADSLKSHLFGFIQLCLLLNLLISIVITVRISRPFGMLLSALDKIGEDSVYVISNDYKYRELNLIGRKFKELVLRIQTLVRQNYQSQLAHKDAELKTLQSQINPHFLFNTLQLLQTGSCAAARRNPIIWCCRSAICCDIR